MNTKEKMAAHLDAKYDEHDPRRGNRDVCARDATAYLADEIDKLRADWLPVDEDSK
jgi:hypothetical protein